MKHSGKWDIRPLSESAVVVYFESSINVITLRQITAFNKYLTNTPFEGLRETVPAYSSLTIIYDPLMVRSSTILDGDFAFSRVINFLHQLLDKFTLNSSFDESPADVNELSVAHQPTGFEPMLIPVAYGGDYGPDLRFVAEHNKLTIEEVIFLHTQPIYTVYMIGFLPGFPYLGGMNKMLACPRKSTPRKLVAAGSVGIAGEQTGVYPMQSPGGWQLIGRTPLSFFNPFNDPPALLSAGDVIKFTAISIHDFVELNHDDANKST
jgi:inhibitor of KinA